MFYMRKTAFCVHLTTYFYKAAVDEMKLIKRQEFYVSVPNDISHYGRPSQFALIRFHARRLDDFASLLIPHNL